MKKVISLLMASVLSLNIINFNNVTISAQENDINSDCLLSQNANINLSSFPDKEKGNIKSDLSQLGVIGITASDVNKIECAKDNIQYTIDCGVEEDVITISEESGNVTYFIKEGDKTDTLVLQNDGDLILDGHKIEMIEVEDENNSNVSLYATVYKGVKSLHPYGSLTSADYNQYLSSGTQNISLGQKLDTITIAALSGIIGSLHGYASIGITLTGIAANVADALCAVNSQTKYLGYKYLTFINNPCDYQYINQFYANTSCTGTCHVELSYEHFTIY